MSTNLVQLAMQFLTPSLISKIGEALGLNNESAKSATEASIPALLAGLAGVASKPDGAKRLDTALQEQDPGLLDNLTSMLGGSNQQSLIDKGSGLLSSLFGGSVTNGLIGAVAKFVGIGDGASKSMLGILGPVVMGLLGREKKRSGLDASGLAQMLTSQKDSYAQAMPAGFANLLGDTDLIENVAAKATTAAPGPAATTRPAARSIETATSAIPERKSSSRWLLWLIVLLVIAALAWYFLGGRGQQVVEQAKHTVTEAIDTADNLDVGGVDLGEQVRSFFDTTEDTLSGITDADSANAALPKLQDMIGQLDNISQLSGQLPPESRQTLTGLINSALPGLQQLIDKVLAIPGVSAIVSPALDSLKMKLNALTQSS